jgi:PEP-CTERM motif
MNATTARQGKRKWLPALRVAAMLCVLSATEVARAVTIASWTFETSAPATAGPFSPEVGSGSALGSHAGSTVYSAPAGNSSTHSFSSTAWNVGDYYQFQVSTTGFAQVQLSWDQTSSNTGPRDFVLQYSTNGTTFSPFGSTFAVLANANPNTPWTSIPGTPNPAYTITENLSSLTTLNNAATVYFRITDNSTVSANGGAVGLGGTDRVDNFTVTATGVPEPGSIVLAALGAVGLLMALRRRGR